MSREITYWLVINVHEFLMCSGATQFYCLNEKNEASTTDNPKKAMRYHTEEGAKIQAHFLGWYWTAMEHKFKADEPCI
jgi:hypothetical protein